MNFFSILQTRKWLEISLKERQKKRWLLIALTTYKECMKDGELLATAMIESGFFEKNGCLLTKKDLSGSAEEVLLLCLQATKFTKGGFLSTMFKKTVVDVYSMRTGYLELINMFFEMLHFEEDQKNNFDLFQKLKMSLALYYTLTHSEHMNYYKNLFACPGLQDIENSILEKKEFEKQLLKEIAKNVIPPMDEEESNEFVMIA